MLINLEGDCHETVDFYTKARILPVDVCLYFLVADDNYSGNFMRGKVITMDAAGSLSRFSVHIIFMLYDSDSV